MKEEGKIEKYRGSLPHGTMCCLLNGSVAAKRVKLSEVTCVILTQTREKCEKSLKIR